MTITKELSEELFKLDRFNRWLVEKRNRLLIILLILYFISLIIYLGSLITYRGDIPRPVGWWITTTQEPINQSIFAWWPSSFGHLQIILLLSGIFLVGIIITCFSLRMIPYKIESPMKSSREMKKCITHIFGNLGFLVILFALLDLLLTCTLTLTLDTSDQSFQHVNNIIIATFAAIYRIIIEIQATLFSILPIENYSPAFLPYLILNCILLVFASYIIHQKTILSYPNPEIWHLKQVIQTFLELIQEEDMDGTKRNEIQNRLAMMVYKAKKDEWSNEKMSREFDNFINSIIQYQPDFKTQEDFFTAYANKYGLQL